jgi:transposase
LAESEQDGATLVPRCRKDLIEERLFQERRDLFSRLDLVFMDTTSLYFEGRGGERLGAYGYSKDYRPQLKQMILSVLIDGDGNPVCTEMWPGNTADVTTLIPVIDRLRKRFAIERICVVADRGMISEETVAELEARGLSYILGVRERNNAMVRDVVLADRARFVPLTVEKRKRLTDYGAKAVTLGGVRYIVCINHEQAEKDAADREAILKSLRRALKKGAKALIGNTGYRRYLKTVGQDSLAIDEARVNEDAKFDGIFVLRTNTALNPLQAMLRYKQLWTIEQTFRTTKHLFATRPIFHKRDETIRGHVFCSFLALVLKKALEDKLAAIGAKCAWPDILADLDSLAETEIEHEGKRFLLRSSPRPFASLALKAASVALPPTVQPTIA